MMNIEFSEYAPDLVVRVGDVKVSCSFTDAFRTHITYLQDGGEQIEGEYSNAAHQWVVAFLLLARDLAKGLNDDALIDETLRKIRTPD